ncbi:MAG: hypothetical protein H7069_09775 [Phormidesmis sp. FL-bin-119]|nr:hypothetical protein [Pedobacter sp.]
MQSDQTGNHGEEEKDTLCDGDLIKRQDWPDAVMISQLQCAYMLEDGRY